MKRTISLQGKTIVITGASSGAGRAAALKFAPYHNHLMLGQEQYLFVGHVIWDYARADVGAWARKYSACPPE